MIQGLPEEGAGTKGSKSPLPREYGQDGKCPGWKTEEGLSPRPLGAWEARGAWRPADPILFKSWKPRDVGSFPHAQVSPPGTLLFFPLLIGPVFLPTMCIGTSFPGENTHPAAERPVVPLSACLAELLPSPQVLC